MESPFRPPRRVSRLSAHLVAQLTSAEPVVLDLPPSNWPDFLPPPKFTRTPKFSILDRDGLSDAVALSPGADSTLGVTCAWSYIRQLKEP